MLSMPQSLLASLNPPSKEDTFEAHMQAIKSATKSVTQLKVLSLICAIQTDMQHNLNSD